MPGINLTDKSIMILFNASQRYLKTLHRFRGIFPSLYLAFLVSTGCMTVGPDYVRPDTQAPEKWNAPLQHGLSADHPDPCVRRNHAEEPGDPLLRAHIAVYRAAVTGVHAPYLSHRVAVRPVYHLDP